MANALAKLFSWADGVKRRVSNPLQTVTLGLERFNEDIGQAGNDADVAYGRSGMKSVLISPEQRAEAARRAADFGSQMGMAAATVYHGSPHKFDKFDSKKIGTGEGAQAYGHGLYLAENPGVAGAYKKNLSQGRAPLEVNLDGAPFPAPKINYSNPDPQQQQLARIRTLLLQEGGDVDRAIARTYGDDAAALAQFRGRVSVGDPGSLYKVDLPDNAITRMLDWDKPLSQQAPEVQRALSGMDGGLTGDQVHQQLFKTLRKQVMGENGGANLGAGAYQARVADDLKKRGVPGIRYLDGGSRGAGGGTSNYVVFPGNEDLLQILERNGVPIK